MKKPVKSAKAASAVEAAVEWANTAIQSGRPVDAERVLRDVLAKTPRSPNALQALGRALLAQQRPRDAIEPLEAALRHGPNPVIETNLGIALEQSGRTADAVTCLQRAIDRQPPFEHAFAELGGLLLSLKRQSEAEAVLKRGLAVAPNSVEMAVLLGGIYLARADRSDAKLLFARTLVNAPSDPRALYGMGAALMLEGDFARAAQRLQQAAAQNPTDVQTRLSLGTCLLELKRWDEGLAALRIAIQLVPQAYPAALKILVTSGRGRFWLKPSAAAGLLRPAARF
jgi:tetratricopeptide (TPR) repeat protein